MAVRLTATPGSLELFDTTVDSTGSPSIFVAYHDAQAYPEYLVSFSQGGQ
jgi:poly [ADP-ribose] polymerase 10/14/15